MMQGLPLADIVHQMAQHSGARKPGKQVNIMFAHTQGMEFIELQGLSAAQPQELSF